MDNIDRSQQSKIETAPEQKKQESAQESWAGDFIINPNDKVVQK